MVPECRIHVEGLVGLGSLAWAGHQIHVSLPINELLDVGVVSKEIPLPHELILNMSFRESGLFTFIEVIIFILIVTGMTI